MQPFNLKFVPLPEGGSRRATNCEIRFDGGAFTLHIFENRESPSPRPGPVPQDWEFVEVGRFSLSPQALRTLQNAVEFAAMTYREAMGHDFPDTSKVQEVLNQIAKRTAASASMPKK